MLVCKLAASRALKASWQRAVGHRIGMMRRKAGGLTVLWDSYRNRGESGSWVWAGRLIFAAGEWLRGKGPGSDAPWRPLKAPSTAAGEARAAQRSQAAVRRAVA